MGKSKGETHSGSFIPLLPDAMSPKTHTMVRSLISTAEMFSAGTLGARVKSTRLKRSVGVLGERWRAELERGVFKEEKARNKVQRNYQYNTGMNNSWIISIYILHWRPFRPFAPSGKAEKCCGPKNRCCKTNTVVILKIPFNLV